MNVYIRNAEAACYGFEKNAECRLRTTVTNILRKVCYQ